MKAPWSREDAENAITRARALEAEAGERAGQARARGDRLGAYIEDGNARRQATFASQAEEYLKSLGGDS